MHLNACLAQPCCGGGSCVFPACRGGRVGGKRGGVEGEASAGPGCGGSGVRGLPDGTLEETQHWSSINWFLCTNWIIFTPIPLIWQLFSTMEKCPILLLKHLLIYLETAEHWSECSFGRLWFWVGESLDLLTPLTCLNQTHTINKWVQCLSGCMMSIVRY